MFGPMKRVLRYEIPVDGWTRTFDLAGSPLHVGSRQFGVVEFWAEDDGRPVRQREFKVCGTGHPVPDHALYWGTTYDAGTSDLVWHLYEVTP